MKISRVLLLCTLLVVFQLCASIFQPPVPNTDNGKLLGKHSFHAPFLFGTTSSIPFWNYGGSAVATENFIRLVPAIRSRVGWVWNTEPVAATSWEVVLEFNIHNTHSPGADGMAFWYAKEPGKTGSLFGYVEDFEGIGIIFDSYDNNGNGDNPSVIAVQGNGQHIKWDYENDLQANQLDRCRADFRNPINGNTKAKIIFNKGSLHVLMDTHGTGQFSYCLSVDHVELKPGFYFGISATTGGLADYHDVYSLVTKDLDPKPEPHEEAAHKGRRGWYDPYKEQPAENVHHHVETPQAPPASTPASESGDNDFIESLREKLKKYGIDDVQNQKKETPPPTPQHNSQVPPPQDPPQQPRKKKTRTPAAAAQQPPQTPPPPPPPAEEPAAQTQVQSQDASDGVSQKTGLLILSALQEMNKAVKATAHKSDLSIIIDRVTDVHQKQSQTQSDLLDLRDHIRKEVHSMMEDLKHETKSLADEIKRLDSMLNTLYIQVDTIRGSQTQMKDEWSKGHHDVKETIKQGTSFGFWTFFILFQLVFTALLIYWKKYRDQSSKNDRYML